MEIWQMLLIAYAVGFCWNGISVYYYIYKMENNPLIRNVEVNPSMIFLGWVFWPLRTLGRWACFLLN